MEAVPDDAPSGGGAAARAIPSTPASSSQAPPSSPFGQALHAQNELERHHKQTVPLRIPGGTHYIHRAKPGEITREHEQYLLTYAMSIGIRHSVTVWSAGNPSGGVRDARSSRHKTLGDVGIHDMKAGVSRAHFARSYKMYFPPDGGRPGDNPLLVTPPHKLQRGFKFKDYAPEIFGRLRKRFNIDDVDYMLSLCGTFNFIEFVSNSKSGEFFFYSHDGRFLIKTQRKSESKFMREILPKYFEFVADHPATMLVRICGAHRVKLPHLRRKMHFVIMMSVFAEATESRPVNRIYDLKGATVGRSAKPGETVRKDKDILHDKKTLNLGPRRGAFVEQIRRDATFLEKMGVMDYSLLVGIQEKDQTHAEESFVFRSNRKASMLSAPSKTTGPPGNGRASHLHAFAEEEASPQLGGGPPGTPTTTLHASASTGSMTNGGGGSPRLDRSGGVVGATIKKPSMPRMFSQKQITTESSERSVDAEDDARSFATAEGPPPDLLLTTTFDGVTSMHDAEVAEVSLIHQQRQTRLDSADFNSFYKIDSVDELGETYHVGIIDIFTKYSTGKRTEHYLKSLVWDGNQISAVPPVSYKDRFVHFIDDICR